MDPLDGRSPEISYPCGWTYQIVGTSAEAIRACVAALLGDEGHELTAGRSSRTGKYVSFRLRMVVRDAQHRREVLAALQAETTIRTVL